MTPSLESSTAILDAYIDRSWRSNAERQRAKGAEFVIGRRRGVYLWDVEGTHRVIDCGTAGGVHSLGHRHPEVLDVLRRALFDEERDTGLWSVPNLPYLQLQDTLARLAPSPDLARCVITHCSTLSVDLATVFAFRVTGRPRMVAYRHGYHGHTGFAAQVTGSPEEGILEHFRLPTDRSAFFETYGDLDELDALLDADTAGIILEPMNYETFAPARPEFMDGLARLCRERGVLLVIDETRTGLGRTGRLWASEHYDLRPDMLVTGKGLSGGLYPVSALLVTEPIYEACMNEHRFAYISSLGGNEIACLVARAVLEISSRAEVLDGARRVAAHLATRLDALCAEHPDRLAGVDHFGCIFTVGIRSQALARDLYATLFRHGVLCHSVVEIEPAGLKLLPPIVMTTDEADEIVEALRASLSDLAP